MERDAAESIALQALTFVAGNTAHLERLLGESGLTVEDLLRGDAAEPTLLAGILDFVLADEARVLAFCAHAGLAPDRPARARAQLPGAVREAD
jgi:hypothetical protein